MIVAQPRSLVGQRPAEQAVLISSIDSGLKLKHPAAADQRAVDGEERILRRRADQNHHAVFDVGQQHVLLRLVEAVNLIDEQQRLLAGGRQPIAGLDQHVAQFLHAAGDGVELLEIGCGSPWPASWASVVLPVPGGP